MRHQRDDQVLCPSGQEQGDRIQRVVCFEPNNRARFERKCAQMLSPNSDASYELVIGMPATVAVKAPLGASGFEALEEASESGHWAT